MSARPKLSLGLPPSRDIVRYAKLAETLGYERVWLFDSPALYEDLWMAIGRLAEATTIGLGAGVAVPSLRHPMVTASAIATVEDLAPGRLITAFGTGFTARRAMGQPAMKWADLARYVQQVRGLLDGDVVEIDDKLCQMIHPPEFAPSRPISSPLWVAPVGPKGFGVARGLDVDGVILTAIPALEQRDWKSMAVIVSGTVLRSGEDHTTERVIEAAGPWFGTGFHAAWEWFPGVLDEMPGGPDWRDSMLAARPEAERHLAVHEGHVTVLPDRDRAAVRAAGAAILQSGWTGDATSVSARFADAGHASIGEIVYCAAGPDIPSELEAFAEAVG